MPLDAISEVAVSVVGAVEEKRSTWRHWNLWAEASRQTMGWRFASAEDREAVVGMIVDAAKQESLTLTPPELVTTPEVFRRADGTTALPATALGRVHLRDAARRRGPAPGSLGRPDRPGGRAST